MDLNQVIRLHATQPLTHQLLLSFLKQYKRPNDKINELLNQHILQPVKRGLYIAGPSLQTASPEPFLLANHILGPSYVSCDSALSYHGLIPERVYGVSAVTTKASRKFSTPAGLYQYAHLPLPYYAFGIVQAMLSTNQNTLIASPEKALCDKVVTTSGTVFRSLTSAWAYLLEDLRMDETGLKELDLPVMRSWLPDAPKKESLTMLINSIAGI